MAAWSAEIANEFIRRAKVDGRALTQMQLQKLVYIAHAWNLAINRASLTQDNPQAWEYGPVYRELWSALRKYGRNEVTREILQSEYLPGIFEPETPDKPATAILTEREVRVIDRVYKDYSKFDAFKLSALTHVDGTPWAKIYAGGEGKNQEIKPELIKEYFVDLASN